MNACFSSFSIQWLEFAPNTWNFAPYWNDISTEKNSSMSNSSQLGWFHLPGDIGQCLVTSLAVTIERGCYWHLAGREPRMLLNILQCAGQHPCNDYLALMSLTLLLRNADSPGCVLVAQSCPTLCDRLDYSPPGSSVHGILQTKTLGWVAISFCRGSSRPRDRTPVLQVNALLSEPSGKSDAPGGGV